MLSGISPQLSPNYLLCEFIIYPTAQLCDKIYSGRQFGCLRLIGSGLLPRLTTELRELSHDPEIKLAPLVRKNQLAKGTHP